MNDTVYFGVHPDATYEYDYELSERPIPPAPTVPAFDIRLIGFPGRKRLPSRKYVSPTQRDTFLIQFQPANDSFPVRFTITGGAEHLCDSLRVESEDAFFNLNATLKEPRSFQISDPRYSILKLILIGPKSR